MIARSFGGQPIFWRILRSPLLLTKSKALVEVHEGEEQWLLLLSTLLLQLREGKDHVHCGPPGSEATL